MSYWDDEDDDFAADKAATRRALFEGLTGRTDHSFDRTSPEDVESMLMTRFAYVYRGEERVNTADAAKFLGVSRRTVQKYLKQGFVPEKSPSYRKLRLAVRQQVTRKAGRQAITTQARQRAAEAIQQTGGVRLSVYGMQGPPPSSKEDLRRMRNAYHEISGDQFEQMLTAYDEGGEQAMQSWLQGTFAGEGGYLPDWTISSIERIEIGKGSRNWF